MLAIVLGISGSFDGSFADPLVHRFRDYLFGSSSIPFLCESLLVIFFDFSAPLLDPSMAHSLARFVVTFWASLRLPVPRQISLAIFLFFPAPFLGSSVTHSPARFVVTFWASTWFPLIGSFSLAIFLLLSASVAESCVGPLARLSCGSLSSDK